MNMAPGSDIQSSEQTVDFELVDGADVHLPVRNGRNGKLYCQPGVITGRILPAVVEFVCNIGCVVSMQDRLIGARAFDRAVRRRPSGRGRSGVRTGQRRA